MWFIAILKNPGEKDISQSRLISLLAFLVVSFVIIKQVWSSGTAETELLLGYMGIAMIGKTTEMVSRHRMRGRVDDPDRP